MALKKSKTTEFGLVANYWKINNIMLIKDLNKGVVSMELFADEQARRTGAKCLLGLAYEVTGLTPEDMADSGKNPYSLTYEFLKTNVEEFQNAEDC